MKKILITILIVVTVIFLVSFISSFSRNPATSFPLFQIPTPTPVSVNTFVRNQVSSPLEKTTIDKTTQQEVEKIQDVVATPSPDGTTTYTFPSVNALIPNEVQTQGNTVVYERTSLFTSGPGGFPSLSSFMKKLGTPEQVIQGNAIYGEGINDYLFPNKGVV